MTSPPGQDPTRGLLIARLRYPNVDHLGIRDYMREAADLIEADGKRLTGLEGALEIEAETNVKLGAALRASRTPSPIPGLSSPQGQAAEDAPIPAARWREKGEPDPHAGRYDCERAKLAGGHLTDDQAAYQIAMLSRGDLNFEAVLATARDRIRWLSRKLVAALSQPSAPTADTGSGEGWRAWDGAPKDGSWLIARRNNGTVFRVSWGYGRDGSPSLIRNLPPEHQDEGK